MMAIPLRRVAWLLAAVLGPAIVPLAVRPAGADPLPGSPALQAWSAYDSAVNARYAAAAGATGRGFFVLDSQARSSRWREAVLRGEVVTSGIDTPGVPGASIHHWVGAVLVPGVTLDQVLDRLKSQAGDEQRSHDDVLASRLLARDGDRLTVYMRLRRTTVITVTYDTEHLVEYRRLGAHRASSRSVSTRIAELADAGTPREREKPPGTDNGFLWRLNAYWRYEEAAGGVLIECESLSLSRSVPFVARPIVSPVVSRVARDSLARTLRGVQALLRARRNGD